MSVTEKQARDFGVKHAAEPIPQDGIVVFFNPACPHCQRSLDNTDMKSQTANGAPIKWVDISTPEGVEAFKNLKGVQQGEHYYTIGKQAIEGNLPLTVWMKNGIATDIITQTDIKRGELDLFSAMKKGASVSSGTSVPLSTPPLTAPGNQR